MAKTNVSTKGRDPRIEKDTFLAGGFGMVAAKQDAEALLRRAVLANLLWEDTFYEDGVSVAENIKRLIPQVEPATVTRIAIEARTLQKLRHVPLLLAREMARLDSHKGQVSKLLPQIILRADEVTEFMALYWKEGRQPLSKQVKLGLAEAMGKFNEYQIAKYNRDTSVKLKDVLFLTHPKPASNGQPRTQPAVDRKGYRRGQVYRDDQSLYAKLVNDTLAVPDTWEVSLSAGKAKKGTWERLIAEKKLGALAFVRNLRNMAEAGVSRQSIQAGFDTINPYWLLPLNYLSAAKYAPDWERELEALMLKGLATAPKLKGYSVFIVDVSGSMAQAVSAKSDFTRMDAGAAMAMLAAEMCEHVSIVATAGSDMASKHQSEKLKPRRGFALTEEISQAHYRLGGGGIFTRQVLDYVKSNESETPDRIIVFSDSQDCDRNKQLPSPFGKKNYIVDVSSHQHGINYKGLWDAEITGWSEHFLKYIAALEGASVGQVEE